ncbi:MAG: putative signal transducing protein [Candidatus Kapaibacteriota bacterium]|jgi:hypothetical protein
MIHLATYNSEIDAELLGSRLKAAGIDYKIHQEEGSEECAVMVFDDDYEEAVEVLEAASYADDEFYDGGASESADDLDDLGALDDDEL